MKTETITVKLRDGEMGAYIAYPDRTPAGAIIAMASATTTAKCGVYRSSATLPITRFCGIGASRRSRSRLLASATGRVISA